MRPQRHSWLEAALNAKAYLTAALSAADVLEIGDSPGGHRAVQHIHQTWHH